MIVKKRHILLLEVLIALALIMLCILPLIYPHTYILLSQKKFIHKVELDHRVNLLYADILEQMYRGDIRWYDIINKREFVVDKKYLEKLPYKGTYRFNETKHKPKTEASYTLYLMKLDLTFVTDTRKEKPETLTYHYDLFVARDLGGELAPE